MTKAGWCGRCAVERVGVRLMTMHPARGLEFREVFVVGVSAEELPDPAPMKHADTDPKRRLVDGSERWLSHICATRATHELQVSSSPSREQAPLFEWRVGLAAVSRLVSDGTGPALSQGASSARWPA